MDTEMLVIDWSVPHVFHCTTEEMAQSMVKAIELVGHKAQILRDVP